MDAPGDAPLAGTAAASMPAFPQAGLGKDSYLQLLGCSRQCFHPLASVVPRMLKMLPSPKAAFHARQQPAASPAAAASSIVREVEAGREPLTR